MEMPEVGSSHRAYYNVLAKGVMDDFARKVGIPTEESEYFIRCLGAVIQERLLAGLPCGIPYVGTIYVNFRHYRRYNVTGLVNNPLNNLKPGDRQVMKRLSAKLDFESSRQVKEMIRDEAPYTGSLKDHYDREFDRKKEIVAMRKAIKRETNQSGKRAVGRKQRQRIEQGVVKMKGEYDDRAEEEQRNDSRRQKQRRSQRERRVPSGKNKRS